MAKIVTLKILVDEDDNSYISNDLDKLFREAVVPVSNGATTEMTPWIIDWTLQGEATPVGVELEDSIMNETYVAGDAFK